MRVVTMESLLLWHNSASKAHGCGCTRWVLHRLDMSCVVSLMAMCAIMRSQASASDVLELGRACGLRFQLQRAWLRACQAVC